MKKYFVIGNPINHSLSPKLHNYWLKENNIDAIYDKIKIEEKNLQTIISEVKEKKINGCLLYTSPSPRDISGSRMPSSA